MFMQYAPWSREEIDACEVGPFPRGKLVGERNGAVVSEVDYGAFLRDRATFLERMRMFEESWTGRAADAIDRIRTHFAS